MINELIVRNFKSIGEGVKIELRPLTILLGPNGSGKSAILESIVVLEQNIKHDINIEEPGKSEIIHIPIKNMFHKKNTEDWLVFEIYIDASADEIKKLVLNPDMQYYHKIIKKIRVQIFI